MNHFIDGALYKSIEIICQSTRFVLTENSEITFVSLPILAIVPKTLSIAIDWPSHHDDRTPRGRRCHHSLCRQHHDTKSNRGTPIVELMMKLRFFGSNVYKLTNSVPIPLFFILASMLTHSLIVKLYCLLFTACTHIHTTLSSRERIARK